MQAFSLVSVKKKMAAHHGSEKQKLMRIGPLAESILIYAWLVFQRYLFL